MQCPLKCSDKEFKRLDLHLGMMHGKEVIEAFTHQPPNPEMVGPDFVSPAIVNNPAVNTVRNNPSASTLSSIKQMYVDLNEMLALRVQQKELMRALQDDGQQKPQQNSIKEYIEMQQAIDKQVDNKVEAIKKQLETSDTKNNDFEMQMLLSLLQGVQPKNAKPATSNGNDFVDTTTT